MKKVQSTVKPLPVEIDDYSVWIAENIEEIEVENEEGTETVFEYELTQLEKDDYILQLHHQQLQTKVENDLAIADLAETLLGGGL